MILVVDDDEATLKLFRAIDSHMPEYSIITSSSEEAVQILANKNIDLLITDFHMPIVSGLHLIRLAKKKYNIPVILITGFYEKAKELNMQADIVLPKPVTIPKIKESILKLLT